MSISRLTSLQKALALVAQSANADDDVDVRWRLSDDHDDDDDGGDDDDDDDDEIPNNNSSSCNVAIFSRRCIVHGLSLHEKYTSINENQLHGNFLLNYLLVTVAKKLINFNHNDTTTRRLRILHENEPTTRQLAAPSQVSKKVSKSN